MSENIEVVEMVEIVEIAEIIVKWSKYVVNTVENIGGNSVNDGNSWIGENSGNYGDYNEITGTMLSIY